MQVKKGYFYFIKDYFFDIVKDQELMQNKENGNKRPCYYCFKDNQNSDIIWFVPVSTRTKKYRTIYNKKIQNQIKNNKTPNVDTIVFGKVSGKENVFLIQNMFPIIERFVENEFISPIDNNKEKAESFVTWTDLTYHYEAMIVLHQLTDRHDKLKSESNLIEHALSQTKAITDMNIYLCSNEKLNAILNSTKWKLINKIKFSPKFVDFVRKIMAKRRK